MDHEDHPGTGRGGPLRVQPHRANSKAGKERAAAEKAEAEREARRREARIRQTAKEWIQEAFERGAEKVENLRTGNLERTQYLSYSCSSYGQRTWEKKTAVIAWAKARNTNSDSPLAKLPVVCMHLVASFLSNIHPVAPPGTRLLGDEETFCDTACCNLHLRRITCPNCRFPIDKCPHPVSVRGDWRIYCSMECVPGYSLGSGIAFPDNYEVRAAIKESIPSQTRVCQVCKMRFLVDRESDDIIWYRRCSPKCEKKFVRDMTSFLAEMQEARLSGRFVESPSGLSFYGCIISDTYSCMVRLAKEQCTPPVNPPDFWSAIYWDKPMEPKHFAFVPYKPHDPGPSADEFMRSHFKWDPSVYPKGLV